jgi:protoporphyrinogen oxidase
MPKMPIIILGAGLTGLSFAYHLKKDYWIYEKEPHPGGLVRTNKIQGYMFDRTGHWLHITHPEVKDFVQNTLKIELQQIQRKSMIFFERRFSHYPFQAYLKDLPPKIGKECLLGFIKASTKPKKKRPKNLKDWSIYYFGQGITRYFMIPYNQKVFGLNIKKITTHWCKRFIPKPNLEEVITALFKGPEKDFGYNVQFFYPKQGGIQRLPDALCKSISNISFKSNLQKIDWKRQLIKINGESINYEMLISTIPLKTLLKLLVPKSKLITLGEQRLRSCSLRYLDVGLNITPDCEFHWIYVPEKRYPFYRLGIYSNVASYMAPKGKASIYIELSNQIKDHIKELLPFIVSSLREMKLLNSEKDIAFIRPQKINWAYVIFDQYYSKYIKRIHRFLEAHSIFSIGRYGRWGYDSMQDAIIAGKKWAQIIQQKI